MPNYPESETPLKIYGAAALTALFGKHTVKTCTPNEISNCLIHFVS